MTAVPPLGPKMLALNERKRRFVWEFLANGCKDAADAARKAGFSDPGPHSSAIRVTAHYCRHDPKVVEAMQEVARTYFGGLLLPAVLAAERLIVKEDHADHAKMVLSVLSRLGLSERTGVDLNVTGEVEVSHTDGALDGLRLLKQFGATREKLIEHFGHSGLARYEKMLAEAAPKVIEHDPNG
jgi:hypothetical protein